MGRGEGCPIGRGVKGLGPAVIVCRLHRVILSGRCLAVNLAAKAGRRGPESLPTQLVTAAGGPRSVSRKSLKGQASTVSAIFGRPISTTMRIRVIRKEAPYGGEAKVIAPAHTAPQLPRPPVRLAFNCSSIAVLEAAILRLAAVPP